MEHYVVSARKYRPATFQSVVGQSALTATLKNAIQTGRLAHSYLFCGSRGVGKTSCARIFAKTINCEHLTPDGEACNECDSCKAFNRGVSMNIMELDAASNNGVDDIRQLVEQVQIPPASGRYRVFIVDEVHMLTPAAFNAFLKTLEEPPEYVVFILATTEKNKIIPTILSRCQIYDFNRITVPDIARHLAYVAQQEGMDAEPAALNVIAAKADGALRDALSIFDQIAAASRGHITYQSAIENLNVLDREVYSRLLDLILAGRVTDTWLLYKDVRDRGFDSHFFINGLADYLRDLMAARDAASRPLLDMADSEWGKLAAEAGKCTPEFLYKAMVLCNDADLNYREATNKQFLVEVLLAKLCQQHSPSPVNSGSGEGQLKPIDRPGTTSPVAAASASAAVSSSQTPPPAPQPPPRSVHLQQPASRTMAAAPRQSSQPAASQPRRVTSVRINPSAPAGAPDPAATHAAAAPSDTAAAGRPFTADDLERVWQRFREQHPSEQLLVTSMAHTPRLTTPTHFVVLYENDKQNEILKENRGRILEYLRAALANTAITFETCRNAGAPMPQTWTQDMVFAKMKENSEMLRTFVKDFKLTPS